MRFGDIKNLALDIDPVTPTWRRRAPSERGPWARLAIWIDHRNLCLSWLPTAREVHEGVFVPLAPIADWLVRSARHIAYEESARAFPTDVDLPAALERWKIAAPAASFDEDLWDDSRFDWTERHFLGAGSDGSWLPNLSFVRVDDVLWVSVAPAEFATEGAPVFFERSGLFQVPWVAAASALGEFVDYVSSCLREAGLTQEYSWSTDNGAFARALSIDLLDYAALELNLSVHELDSLLGVKSEQDLLRKLDLPAQAGPADSAALQALRDLEIDRGAIEAALECDLSTRASGRGLFGERRMRLIDAAPRHSPEEQGRKAAELLRKDLHLDGEAIDDIEDLLRAQLEIEVEESSLAPGQGNRTVAGGHRNGSAKVLLFNAAYREKPWSRRMEIARSAGHLLLDSGLDASAIGAGSSGRAVGPRRRRSGAFAAELLLPTSEIIKRSSGVLDAIAEPGLFTELMETYGVGARTAAWQCYNAGLLSSRDVTEKLIDAYGAQA